MKKTGIATIISILILVSMLLVSCSSGSQSSNKSEYYLTDTSAYVDYAKESIGMMDGDDYYEWEAPTDTQNGYSSNNSEKYDNDLDQRKIIKNASVSFQTKTYDQFISALRERITMNNGYIQYSDSNGGGIYDYNYYRSAVIIARIPANNYDSFMQEISTLGVVTQKNESKDDVTSSYIDMESRLKALRTEYDSLLAILEKAEDLSDVIMLHDRLSDVNYQIERYESSLKKYDDLISYCTITVNVREVKKEEVVIEELTLGERISEGLSTTMEDIKTGLENFAVDFVSNLPYIIIMAVIVAINVIIIVAIVKHCKKSRAKARRNAVQTQTGSNPGTPVQGNNETNSYK